MKKHLYKARWGTAGQPDVASVDFRSSHDSNAKKQADKLGRDLGVSNTPRTLYCGNRLVE